MKKKEYIQFDLVHQTEKTRVYAVRNIKCGLILGYIKWYGPWRQYCFETLPNAGFIFIFSKGCLKDITEFIEQLMNERKK